MEAVPHAPANEPALSPVNAETGWRAGPELQGQSPAEWEGTPFSRVGGSRGGAREAVGGGSGPSAAPLPGLGPGAAPAGLPPAPAPSVPEALTGPALSPRRVQGRRQVWGAGGAD